MEELSAKLARTRFEAALNTEFEVALPDRGHVLSLQLVELTGRPAPRNYEQYSALFRGPAEPLLPQGTYAMKHAAFGELPLFIVPVARDASGVTYEACVVRRTESDAPPRT